jgi:hypothetical protein
MSFPLYDILKNKSKNVKSLTENEIDEFINFIDKSINDTNVHDHLYTVVKKYSIIELNNKSDYSIPFNGKQCDYSENNENVKNNENVDISFDFLDFPDELQRMLYSFILLERKEK